MNHEAGGPNAPSALMGEIQTITAKLKTSNPHETIEVMMIVINRSMIPRNPGRVKMRRRRTPKTTIAGAIIFCDQLR